MLERVSPHLTEAERLRRIGELICLAVAREASPKPEEDEPPQAATVEDPAETILGYLRRVGAASPAELNRALGLSRSTTDRTLQRLRRAGWVGVNGRTRGAVYRPCDLSRN